MIDRWRRTGRVARLVLIEAWRAAGIRAGAGLMVAVVNGVLPAASAYLSKLVVDGVAHGSRSALTLGVAYLGAIALPSVVAQMGFAVTIDVGDRVAQSFEHRLLGLVAAAPGLEHLERPDYADRVQAVRTQFHAPMGVVTQIWNLLVIVPPLVWQVALLASVGPLVALAPLLTLPFVALDYLAQRRQEADRLEVAPHDRLMRHYVSLATDPPAAHEVRVFGLGPLLRRRYDETAAKRLGILLPARMRRSAIGVGSGLTQGAAIGIGVAALMRLASIGRATPGDIVMTVGILLAVVGGVRSLTMIGSLAQVALMAENYLWLLDYRSPVDVVPDAFVAGRVDRGIRLEDVTFAYPGTDEPVLRGVDLDIPTGTTVAIVGENGAGKTTLVKLLLRFYDPTSGRVTVDGADLRTLDLAAWRASSTAIFQDFASYHVLARESIGVGNLTLIDDSPAVLAAARRAGADEVIGKMPAGLETQLGREFPGGVEVSEGERQRIALARGSMRTSPALVVLDEPTASLDAKAEAAVFARFAEMAAPAAGARPVTILVSHRFSTVRMADRIVVMEQGRVVDVGTHDELVARGGLYAELYALQARAYE